jgi:YegS/Rv2252/BmrU family lipid kinase
VDFVARMGAGIALTIIKRRRKMIRQKILLIINPKAGPAQKFDIKSLAFKYIDSSIFDLTVNYTEYAGHAKELAQKAAENKYDIVAAAGGDGTVNEVGCGLVNTHTPLAILPCGSGNGLARHLGIPLKLEDAIKHINTGKHSTIDYMSINGELSFNVSGIGFDAEVAHSFATMEGRGMKNYIKAGLNNYLKSKNKIYRITANGKTQEYDAWMISLCNSNQFGNNAYIAPEATIDDGLIDVCILKKISLWQLPWLTYKLFNKRLASSSKVSYIKTSELCIETQGDMIVHVDGEPQFISSPIKVKIDGKLHIWK